MFSTRHFFAGVADAGCAIGVGGDGCPSEIVILFILPVKVNGV